MGRAGGRDLVVLLVAVTIVVALVVPSDAFLDKLFGKENKPNDGGSHPSANGAVRSGADLDYDSESDSEDESEGERSQPPPRPTPARGGEPRRAELDATKPRASELAESQLRRARDRQTRASGQRKEAHGRTRRNQLRHAGKSADSYLEEEDHWHRESELEDRRAKNRARERPRARDGRNWPNGDSHHSSGDSKTGGAGSETTALSNRFASVDDEIEEEEEEIDEEEESYGDAGSRAKSKKDALAKAKYVPTGPSGKGKGGAAREEFLSRMNLARPTQGANQERRQPAGRTGDEAEKRKPVGADLVSKSFWQKGLTSVAKATGKGLKATKKALVELPKDVSNMVDSLSAHLELDNRGKIRAMDKRAAKAAKFVRSEFAKFTVEWARIMEEALDYLGDKDLDQVTWDEGDMLDFRKDALHSLVIGYEFIRMMIIWRENMLLAHEGFRMWLERARRDCEEDKSLNVMTDFGYTPPDVYNYILLMAWDFIKYDSLEIQLNLDYLMDLEDSRPKNYMSRFFRNIIVLQEIYFPTMRALEKERSRVKLPSEEQPETYDFFMEFRQMVAERRFDDIDIEAPKELAEFVARMTPQLRMNKLVYSKSHVKSLAAKMEQAKMNRQRGLASMDEGDLSDGEEEEEDSEDDDDYY